jgi:hypothetical protein
MKAINRITSGKTESVSLKSRRTFKGLCCWLSRHCLTIIFTIFLLMIVAPIDASTGSGNGKRNGCHAKRTTINYLVIKKANKKSVVNNKNNNKSRGRNYSFPV